MSESNHVANAAMLSAASRGSGMSEGDLLVVGEWATNVVSEAMLLRLVLMGALRPVVTGGEITFEAAAGQLDCYPAEIRRVFERGRNELRQAVR